MKIIKHIEPPVQDKLKAHYFDRYRPSFDGNKILSSVGDQSEGRDIQPGRCYDFDGVDDYIAIASPDVGTLYVSGLDSDGELNTTLTIGYFSNQYQISGSGKIWNIKVWTSDTATETQKKSYTLESGLFAWYKCDEGTGVNSYDSSGNGNHGTIMNASESIHSTQPIYSWQNEVGYSIDSNFYIPRDESNPSKDVLGNDLEYKGQVAYNALLKQSNCLNIDGIDDYIEFTNTDNWDRLEHQGTSELTISGNTIQGTEGSIYDLRVYDSSDNLIAHYPCSEGGGLKVYDVIGNNHGTLVNATLETVWDKQDEYHYNIKEGYSKGKGFSTRVTDVRDNTDTDYIYTSQEGINYYYSYGDDVNPTTGRYDPDGNPLGYTSEYFNFYKELTSGVTGGSSLLSISSAFAANTFKIDLEVKSGIVSSLQGRDVSLHSRFNTALIDTYGFAGNTVFTDQGDFYWAISGLDPTYGESYPEINGFPIGTTSEDLRNLLVSIGIEDIEYFVSDLSNYTDRPQWQYCLQRTFSIPFNINNTYGRTEIELGIYDIKPNGATSTGNMANYYSQYNTNLEVYSSLNLRCYPNTWVHIYSVTIDENHVVPASRTIHNQDATGLRLENIAGRHHNGAETLIDFTGGVEDNPYAAERNLPADYAFNQNYLFKDQSMKGVRESNFLVTDVDSDDVMSVLNYLKRKDGTLLRLEGATSISFRVQTHSGAGYEIDWGDGTVTSTTSNQLLSHTYLTPYTGDIMLIVEPDDVSRITCSNPGLAFDLIKLEPFTNLTYVNFSSSNSITGDVKYLADSITYLLIGGQNTVYGNVKDLPNSLTYLRVDGNNTLSGDVKDLPRSITELRVQGNTTIYGDVADLPRGLLTINTRNTPNIGGHASDLPTGLTSINMSHSSIYGDLGDLPRTLDSLFLTGGTSLSGDIADLPPVITNISDISSSTSAIIYGDIADLPNSLVAITIRQASNTITGDIGNLHEGLQRMVIYGNNTITGDIGNLHEGLQSITIYGNNTITGDIGNLHEGLQSITIYGNNTVYGDLAELPSTLSSFVVIGNSSISDYSGKSWLGLPLTVLVSRPATGGLSTAEVDQLLIDLADIATWSGSSQINLTGNNAPRSSASDAAVTLLQSKGVTVTTN